MENSNQEPLPLKHPGISALKNKIKEVMTGVLTEVFQSNGDLQESLVQSRLYEPQHKKTPEEIQKELESLSEALNRLDLFCQSAKKQLEKAIDKTKNEQNKIFHSEETTQALENPSHQFSKEAPGPSKSVSHSTLSIFKKED